MTRQAAVDWLASILAALALGVLMSVLGAPLWASVGASFIGFWVQRVRDGVRP